MLYKEPKINEVLIYDDNNVKEEITVIAFDDRFTNILLFEHRHKDIDTIIYKFIENGKEVYNKLLSHRDQ